MLIFFSNLFVYSAFVQLLTCIYNDHRWGLFFIKKVWVSKRSVTDEECVQDNLIFSSIWLV